MRAMHCLLLAMREWRQRASVARISFGFSSANCSSERPLTSCVRGQVVGQVPAVLRLGQLYPTTNAGTVRWHGVAARLLQNG